MSPSPTVTPWPSDTPLSESAIRARFQAEDLAPYRWANDSGTIYSPHRHSYHKVLYVVQGEITFGLLELGRHVTLRPGDRLDLPPFVLHDALVGPEGVVC